MQEVETTMQIHQSAEDYLETILMLTQRMGKVRSIDVVNELGFTKASVSIAMKSSGKRLYLCGWRGQPDLAAARLRDRRADLQPPSSAGAVLCSAGRGCADRCRGCLPGRAYPQRADPGGDPG